MKNSNKSEYFFGKNLRFLRKQKKLTLFGMSDLLGISKSAISDYETNKSIPGLDIVQKFSMFFEIPIDELYNSDITERNKSIKHVPLRNSANSGLLNKDEITFENEKYQFYIKLLNQKLESIQLQIQMLNQLLDSREAENSTLKINIKLLEEQLRSFTKKTNITDPIL